MPKNPDKLNRFWQELKRRNMFRVIATYAATAYIIIEVVNNLTGPLHLPEWFATLIVILLIIGLPVTLILSWIFDFTPGGIKKTVPVEAISGTETVTKSFKRRQRVSNFIIAALMIIVVILAYREIFERDTVKKLRSKGEKISVAVMPFQNMTNDTTWNVWQDGIQQGLISSLSNTGELFVRQKESINDLLQTQGLVEYAAISPAIVGSISQKLDADFFIFGSIQQAGPTIRLDAQLIDTKTKEVIKPFEVNGPYKEEIIFDIIDSLRKKVTDFLIISKLINEDPGFQHMFAPPKSAEALKYFVYGGRAYDKGDFPAARNWHLLRKIQLKQINLLKTTYLPKKRPNGHLKQILQKVLVIFTFRQVS